MFLRQHAKTICLFFFASIYFLVCLRTFKTLPFLNDDLEMIQKGALLFEFPSSFLEPDISGRNHILWYALLGGLYQVFGLSPFPYYVCNLLLHGLAAFLIVRTARRLGVGPTGAWISSFFFLVLCFHFPIVGWIGEMCRPMMLVFLLAALLFFDDFRKTSGKKFLFLSIGAWFLAMHCIEEAIMFPFLLAGYDLWVRRQKIRDFFSKKELGVYLPFFTLMALCVLSQKMLYSYGVHDNLDLSLQGGKKILGILWALSAAIIPRREFLEQFTMTSPNLPFRLFMAGLCFLPFWLGLLNPGFWSDSRSRRIAFFGFWWFAVLSFPFVLIKLTTSWTDYKPRYLYAPSVGLAFFIGTLADWMFAKTHKITRPSLRALFTAAVLLSCCYFYAYNLWTFGFLTKKWAKDGRLYPFSVWVPWGDHFSGSPALARMLYESQFPLRSPEIQARAS